LQYENGVESSPKGEPDMGSIKRPKQRNYGRKTCIDIRQPYQVAYWKQRFDVSEEELREAVQAAGELARNVEAHLKSKGAC
jgi:hypothetical protein